MLTNPKVSIIVTTYNRPYDDVLECLKSIQALTYQNIEVILVDNSSKTPSIFSALKKENISLIDLSGLANLGVPGGRNVGINKATGDYIFLVDDDAVLDENCLAELLAVAENNRSIGILGPLTFRYDNPLEIWFYSHQTSGGGFTDVIMVVGAAFMVRRTVFEEIGLFDGNYFLYHEEWDLCRRAQQAGYRTVCVNSASCLHKVSTDDNSKLLVPSRAYYYYRNLFMFAGRNEASINGVLKLLFKHLLYTGPGTIPTYFVLLSLRKKKLNALKAYIHGIMDGVVVFAKLSGAKKATAQLKTKRRRNSAAHIEGMTRNEFEHSNQ